MDYLIGTLGIGVFIFLVVVAVLALLTPIFVLTIRTYVIMIDRKMDKIIVALNQQINQMKG